MSLAALLVAVVASLASASPGLRSSAVTDLLHAVSDCSGGAYDGKFTSLVLSPVNPIKGEPVILKGMGILAKQVSGGTGTAVVSLNGAAIFQASVATCGNSSVPLPLGLGNVNVDAVACPTNGNMTLGVSLTLPIIAPSGNYDIKLVAKDQDGQNAFCVDAQFQL